jgi:hypothetical protein
MIQETIRKEKKNFKRNFFSNHLGHDFSAKDLPKPGVA